MPSTSGTVSAAFLLLLLGCNARPSAADVRTAGDGAPSAFQRLVQEQQPPDADTNDGQLQCPEPVDTCRLLPVHKRDESKGGADQRIVTQSTYTVGVLAIAGVEETYRRHNVSFSDYLTMTAGRRFDPPVAFRMLPVGFEEMFDKTATREIDFNYVNPSASTCLEAEFGTESLVSHIANRVVNDQRFTLSKFGGVIAVRADNTDIRTLQDLRNRTIAAASISAFGAGQMQFRELELAGLSYVQDPKQLVFTSNQGRVVNGVKQGLFDVGFIRTDQIERTRDSLTGQLMDPNEFRIINPQRDVNIDGVPFPFTTSTQLYPEWKLAASDHVPTSIAAEVQSAMLALTEHAQVGALIEQCELDSSASNSSSIDCTDVSQLVPKESLRCDTTYEVATTARLAMQNGNYAGFRTAFSYTDVRDMLQEIRFLNRDPETGIYSCPRPSQLYEAIQCPAGHFRRSRQAVDTGCQDAGIPCPSDDYTCICSPCIKAFDVDVSALVIDDGNDSNDSNDSQVSQQQALTLLGSGCPKMSVCGVTQQTVPLTFQAIDNKNRTGALVTVTVHDGDTTSQAAVYKVDTASGAVVAASDQDAVDRSSSSSMNITSIASVTSNVHRFVVMSKYVGSLILEIFLDGEQIPESPLRVQIVPRDCEAEYDDLRHADVDGTCVCNDNTVELFGRCVLYAIFLPCIFGPALVLFLFGVMWYVEVKRQEADSVWAVKPDELLFTDPPRVIGQGTFGLVLLAEYRGTQVAVKRVLAPRKEDMVQNAAAAGAGAGTDAGADGGVDNSTDSSEDVEAAMCTAARRVGTSSAGNIGHIINIGMVREARSSGSNGNGGMSSLPASMTTSAAGSAGVGAGASGALAGKSSMKLKAGMFHSAAGMSSSAMAGSVGTVRGVESLRESIDKVLLTAASVDVQTSAIAEGEVETDSDDDGLPADLKLDRDAEASYIDSIRPKNRSGVSLGIASGVAPSSQRTSRQADGRVSSSMRSKRSSKIGVHSAQSGIKGKGSVKGGIKSKGSIKGKSSGGMSSGMGSRKQTISGTSSKLNTSFMRSVNKKLDGRRAGMRTFDGRSKVVFSGRTSGLDSQLVLLRNGSRSGSGGGSNSGNGSGNGNRFMYNIRSTSRSHSHSHSRSTSHSHGSSSKGGGTGTGGIGGGFSVSVRYLSSRLFNIFRRNRGKQGNASSYSRQKEEFIQEMRLLSKLRHPCITTVMGAVIAKGQEPTLVMEYMSHGSLYDLLHNETMVLDGRLILNFLRDIASGVRFLHSADPQVIHGDLKSANVLVDSKFRAKVADFGFSHRKKKGAMGTPFFMAPELLRGESSNTAASDMYSVGVILYELYSRRDPYEGDDALEVLRKVCDPKVNKRPPVPESCPPKVSKLMKFLLVADPSLRPTAGEFDNRLKELTADKVEPRGYQVGRLGSKSIGLGSVSGIGLGMSSGGMLGMVSTGATITSAAVAPIAGGLSAGRHHSVDLLSRIFPPHIARVLERGGDPEPESHDMITIFFSDIVGFTNIAASFSPFKVSSLLNRLYLAFDELTQKYDLFKIETIGDAYMCASNLAKRQDEDHVKRVAHFALDVVKAAGRIAIDEDDLSKGYVQIRAGFHSGPVVSNVVGALNPRYGVFGDSVNVAARMESTSEASRVQCSERSALLLMTQDPRVPVHLRGEVAVKGRGTMTTYWVK